MQHPPKELHSHLGLILTTLLTILSTFAQRDPKSPDCVVDDDDNDVNGEEDENDVTMYAQCWTLMVVRVWSMQEGEEIIRQWVAK